MIFLSWPQKWKMLLADGLTFSSAPMLKDESQQPCAFYSIKQHQCRKALANNL
jgi:hypothetical protein